MVSFKDCAMLKQGYKPGSCLVETAEGEKQQACLATLGRQDNSYRRVIKAIQLSRPEDYLSIYQSGCNHTCLKCHSHEFSKKVSGDWMSAAMITTQALNYRQQVTVFEPKWAATSWHAHRLCHHCGSCVVRGICSADCPRKLKPGQIRFSSQGFGPARNIVAFTGGDLLCRPEFYLEVAEKIKRQTDDLWILLETNGFGLTPQNLKRYAAGGIDAFWLDIKAYSEDIYQRLCSTTNKHILDSVEQIVSLGFTLEILTLYIPGLVETREHASIARLICKVDPGIPTTLLAFFPCYRLAGGRNRAPTTAEMIRSYLAMKQAGMNNLRLGNLGIFIKTEADRELFSEYYNL